MARRDERQQIALERGLTAVGVAGGALVVYLIALRFGPALAVLWTVMGLLTAAVVILLEAAENRFWGRGSGRVWGLRGRRT